MQTALRFHLFERAAQEFALLNGEQRQAVVEIPAVLAAEAPVLAVLAVLVPVLVAVFAMAVMALALGPAFALDTGLAALLSSRAFPTTAVASLAGLAVAAVIGAVSGRTNISIRFRRL